MRVTSLFVGGSGVAVSEVASDIQLPSSGDTSEIIKIIVQVVIAVATLIGLFKKKQPNGSNTLNK